MLPDCKINFLFYSLGPMHLEDEISFRAELFRPGGKKSGQRICSEKRGRKNCPVFLDKISKPEPFKPNILSSNNFVLKFCPTENRTKSRPEIQANFLGRNNLSLNAISSSRCIAPYYCTIPMHQPIYLLRVVKKLTYS